MAIMEMPESLAPTATASGIENLNSDLNQAVRRRRGSSGFEPATGIDSADVNTNDDIRDDACGSGAGFETMSKSVGDGNLREEERSDAVVNGEENKTTEATTLYKFSYRASTPAHRRIRESPLSSDAIFRQVLFISSSSFLFFGYKKIK